MCIILDANLAGEMFSAPPSSASLPVLQWISSSDGNVVIGGKLAKELVHSTAARRLILEWLRSGGAIRVPAEEIEAQIAEVEAVGECKSNDIHILGLARASGVRVLFTRDKLLMGDFKNRKLIKPKGRIYQREEHRDLLVHRRGCPGFQR